jgi:hypothetical protein
VIVVIQTFLHNTPFQAAVRARFSEICHAIPVHCDTVEVYGHSFPTFGLPELVNAMKIYLALDRAVAPVPLAPIGPALWRVAINDVRAGRVFVMDKTSAGNARLISELLGIETNLQFGCDAPQTGGLNEISDPRIVLKLVDTPRTKGE